MLADHRLFAVGWALGGLLLAFPAAAQVVVSGGATVVLEPSQGGSGPVHFSRGPRPERGNDDKPKPDGEKEGKPDDKDKDKKDKDKKDGKAEETVKPLVRPTAPRQPPNAEELRARPDAEGKVRFNFTGQPWPAVLEWLATVCGMSLDWQELPPDFLNLATQRSYTLDEARDLINRHLLARGYTLLRQGEVLSVLNLKKVDAGLVPRVEPEQLDGLPPYEFVRVSFPLDWLMAEAAAEELKPMLSPNGKLTPLANTNRLEAMDAAVNLREIRRLLAQEQSADGQERLVREFVLQYARASEVLEQLQTLVGSEQKPSTPGSSSGRGGSHEQMQQQMQQMMAQLQQQQQQGKGPPQLPKKVDVRLVLNQRRNSVIAHAPANKMAVVEQAVKVLDVPGAQGEALLGSVTRMQVYRLAAIDPEPLVKTLEELAGLDPSTRLQVDKANKSIIAYAPLADHVTIRALIEKLDGSGRRFEVIQLRRLEADYVAGTVDFLINGTKPQQTQRRSPWDWNPWGHERRQSDEKSPEFRVDADVEYNRLLLWANDVELQEVRKLLVKLGEMPPEGGNPNTVRVIDAPAGEATDEWLQRLRRVWPGVAPNPLFLPPAQEESKPQPNAEQPSGAKPQPGPAEAPGTAPATSPSARSAWRDPSTAAGRVVHLAQLSGQRSATAQTPRDAGPPPAPVHITRGADGKLIVSSSDTAALDRLESLLEELAPPPRSDYKIYRLKYAWAYGVAALLRDVFKENDKDGRRRGFWDMFSGPSDSEKTPTRLSKRRPLRILSDTDSNSLLVQGADPGQLRKIEELIEFYDRPEPVEARSVRQTEVYYLKYAQAKTVAEILKDVYRDLLSPNDKALQNNSNQQRAPERSYTYIFDSSTNEEQKKPNFKGPLSIGYDETSNTIIVSAQTFLTQDVARLIQELDRAAEPTQTTTQIFKLGPGASAAQVQSTLGRMFGDRSSGEAQPKPTTQPPPPDAGSSQSGGREGGYGRRRGR